jgi:hypothetical protein
VRADEFFGAFDAVDDGVAGHAELPGCDLEAAA